MTISKIRGRPWRSLSEKELSLLTSVATKDEEGNYLVGNQGISDFIDYMCLELARAFKTDAGELSELIKDENIVFYRRMDALIHEKGYISIYDPLFTLFVVPDYQMKENDYFDKVNSFFYELRSNSLMRKKVITYLLLSLVSLIFMSISISMIYQAIHSPEIFVRLWYTFGLIVTIVGGAVSCVGIIFFIYQIVRCVKGITVHSTQTDDACYEDVWDEEYDD